MSLARANKVLEGSAFADLATSKVCFSFRFLPFDRPTDFFRLYRFSLLPISPRSTNFECQQQRKMRRTEEELLPVASSPLSPLHAKRTTETLRTPSSSKETSSVCRRRRRTLTKNDWRRSQRVEKDERSSEVTSTRSWTTRLTRLRIKRRRGKRTLRWFHTLTMLRAKERRVYIRRARNFEITSTGTLSFSLTPILLLY